MRGVGHATASPLGELLADQFLTAAASNCTPMLLEKERQAEQQKAVLGPPHFRTRLNVLLFMRPSARSSWRELETVPALKPRPSWDDDPSRSPLGSSGFQTYTLGRVMQYKGCKSHL
jgi:hypothetical protein